jgi:hypothetical protein
VAAGATLALILEDPLVPGPMPTLELRMPAAIAGLTLPLVAAGRSSPPRSFDNTPLHRRPAHLIFVHRSIAYTSSLARTI